VTRRLWILFAALIAVACVQIQVGGERKTDVEVGTLKTEKKDDKTDRPDRPRPER